MKKNTETYLLACEISNMLQNGKLTPGEYIGSERLWAEKFNVNRNLIRQAIERLNNEYEVYIEEGKVYKHFEKIPVCLQKFESLSLTGEKMGLYIDSSLIEFSLIETNKKLSQKMDVPIGTRVWKIVRLRKVDGKNISIESSFIPTSEVPYLSHTDFENQSLYHILEKKHDIIPWYSKETIRIVNSRYDESEYLGILVNEPVILKKAHVFDKENRYIEFSEDILLPEYYYFMKRGLE